MSKKAAPTIEDKKNTVDNDPNRQSIIDTLKDLGIEADLSRTTKELTTDLQAHVRDMNKRIVKQETDKSSAWLNSIAKRTIVTDKEFLLRLNKMGIKDLYLTEHKRGGAPFYLFSDNDSNLTDEQIHARIRTSGINPIATAEIFQRNLKRPEGMKRARD